MSEQDNNTEFVNKSEQAEKKTKTNGNGEIPEGFIVEETKPKPIIRPKAGELVSTAENVERIMVEAGFPIYQRGPMLVRPVEVWVRDSDNKQKKTKVAKLLKISRPYLQGQMEKAVEFQKYIEGKKGEEGKWVKTSAPGDVAQLILDRQGDWLFPYVYGIHQCQSVRPDGSIVFEEGYDEKTCTIFTNLPTLTPFPTKFTLEAAQAASKRIKDLLSGFPFVGEDKEPDDPDASDDLLDQSVNKDAQKNLNLSVALSAILTAVLRVAMDVVPGHVISSPDGGHGKTYLGHCIARIATGRRARSFVPAESKEETEKKFATVIIEGQSVVLMDNMSEKLQGNLFCEATEQPEIMLRKFGALEGIYIEQCFTFLATGVNVTATKTMERRVLLSELDARHPRAYRKRFKKSPYRIIAETRGQFITDILTIYQCWLAAGSPKVSSDFASYGQYSDLIRSMLVWLGEADPVDSTEKLFNTDPERIQISEIFHACRVALETMKPAYKLAALASCGLI